MLLPLFATFVHTLEHVNPVPMTLGSLLFIGALVATMGPIITLLGLFSILASIVIWFKISVGVFRGRESMQGKTVLVTGAARGIGRETAKELARRGARVVIADINETMAKRTASEIVESTGNPKVEARFLDLGSFASVGAFAKTFLEQVDRLDVLVNNAGVLKLPNHGVTQEGVSRYYAVNYLGPFLLTNLLLPLLRRSKPSRIVVVSSLMHVVGDVQRPIRNAFKFDQDLDDYVAYNDSKLALVLFTTELSRRLAGTGVTANSLHPGCVATDIAEHLPFWKYLLYKTILALFLLKNQWQGAQTSLYLAISDEVTEVSGKYFSDCRVAEPSELCDDLVLARRLWEVSENVTELSKGLRSQTYK